MPILSVIVPFYNGEKYFKRAFESILSQTIGFENIEVILINDCSTDSSPQIAKNYAEKYENCKYIDLSEVYDSNLGFPGRPRNIGLKEVTSDYVVFLDIDDAYHDDAFEILYNTIIKEGSDFIIANYYIQSSQNVVKHIFCNTEKELFTFHHLKNQETFNKVSRLQFTGPYAKLFKKSIIDENDVRFPEDGPVEDAYFYFNYLNHCDTITILPNTYMYQYNEYSDSLIHTHDKKLFFSYIMVFKQFINYLNENYKLSCDLIVNEYLSTLLAIFINIDASKNEKKELLEILYDFEKNYVNVNLTGVEVKILNDCIINRHFEAAIILSKLYNFLYNNKFIINLYRKWKFQKHK